MPDLSCTMQNLLVTACELWPGTEEYSDSERSLVPLPWFMLRWFYPPLFCSDSAHVNTKHQISREWEDRTQTERRYLQNISDKKSCLKFTKQFLNEITGNQTTWLRNRQKIWIDTSPKKMHDQQAYETVFDIMCHQGIPNYDAETLLYTWENGGSPRHWQSSRAGEGVGSQEALVHFRWGCRMVLPLWRTVWWLLTKLSELSHGPAVVPLAIHPNKLKIQPPHKPAHRCG